MSKWTWLKGIDENRAALFYRAGNDYEAIEIKQEYFLFNLDEIIDKRYQ